MHSAPPAIPRPFYTQNMADLTSMTLEALKALGTPEAIDELIRRTDCRGAGC